MSEDTKVTKEGSKMFSSEHIKDKVLTITSEHPSYENNFERKFQAKIYYFDQIFEKKKNN